MVNAYRNVAERIVNAEERFIEYAMTTANLDRAAALRAFAAYRRAKAIKIDAVGGQFTFTHGAFGDAAVIIRAAQEAQ